MQFRLSPTTLNSFLGCPLCFWLSYNKYIALPSGPMSTITSGMDSVIKEYMDRYRLHGKIPPFLQGKVPGKLIEFLPKSLSANLDGNMMTGRLDECLVLDNNLHAPLDHKTKGYAPRSEEVHEAYQLQMDCYTLLLEKNGHSINNTGYIVYYYPDFGELHEGVPFRVHATEIKTHPQRALKVFNDAIKCLEGDEPNPSKGCGTCEYVKERADDHESHRKAEGHFS